MKMQKGLNKLAENEFVVGSWVINDETVTASKDGKVIRLSPIYFGLLRFFSRRLEQIVTREQLNWTGSKPRTIDVQIKRLRDKLDLKELQTIYGAGYCLLKDVPKWLTKDAIAKLKIKDSK